MIELRSLEYSDILALINSLGEESYRALQIYKWLHRGIDYFDEMTDLSKDFRNKLTKFAYIKNIRVLEQLISADGTAKFINLLNDNNLIESVFMSYHYGNSLCISTQVGCKMKCMFCASGFNGYIRNLTAGEMLGQIFLAQKALNKKINNIVLMGIGEPLDNFEAVLKFINIIKEKHGINMSERSITLSTCGIIDKIKALADLRLKITLAISLHSPLQEERENLMPIAKNNPLGKLIEAIDYYILRTQRRVTIEYGLIEKVNDSLRHAQLLGKLLKGRLVHINVIPINPVENSKFSPSSSNRIYPFINILNNKYNIKTTVRRTLGKEIKASCGQLRNNYIKLEIKK